MAVTVIIRIVYMKTSYLKMIDREREKETKMNEHTLNMIERWKKMNEFALNIK